MLYQQIASNKRKTLVVIALYMALFVAVGIGIGYYAIGNAAAGVIIALVAGGLYSMMMIANAFGDSSSIIKIRGIGTFAIIAISVTIFHIIGA